MNLLSAQNKPLFITLLYLVMGLLWIFFSDRLMIMILGTKVNSIIWVGILKGFFYVILTAVLLYSLTKNLYQDVNQGKRELQLVFSNPNIGLFKLNRLGNFEFISDNTCEILKFSRHQLLGTNIFDLTPERYQQRDIKTIKKILSTEEDNFILERCFLDRKGNELDLLLFGSALRNEEAKVTGYIVAFQNITERKFHLRELENQNQKLSEIAYLQSHVLRAPVARILGLLNLLEIEYPKVRKQAPDLVDGISVSAKELDEIIHRISQKTDGANLRDLYESEHNSS